MGTPTPTPTPTSALTQAAPTAEKPKAAPKPTGKPAVAVHRINGTIEPGTIFKPTNAAERDELVELGAVRDLTEAEQALYEKLGDGATVEDADETLG